MQRRGNATDSREKENTVFELQRRVPPQNIEAERAVLGSIMLFSELIHSVVGILKPKDFYLERHQWIFEAITEQEAESNPLDIISVANKLKVKGQLDKAGGIAYLGELVDMIPSAAHIEHYGQIIKEKSVLRQIIGVSTEIASEAYEEQENVAQFLDSAEKRFFEIRETGEKNKDMAPVSEIVKDAFKTIEKLYERKELVTGVPTGFEEFDKMSSGLQPSDLVILAGRPSMGKTSLAMNMVANAAVMHGVPVVVFSLEMSKEQLVMRLLCSQGRVDASRLRTGNMKDGDIPRLMQAATDLAKSKIFIDDGANSSLLEMRSKCRRLKMEHGLGMIMIDYLQLMKGDGKGGDSREREISDISRGLKALAKELHVPILALSQLNRSLERRPDKRPMPSDLRESGAIEQDADMIVFVYRDEVYNPETEDRGVAEIIIGKQRNGPIGTARVRFFHEYTRFDNLYPDQA
ncbi:MAG: replicative DNA helicase [Myxococcales bacterium]|nr:replicative DNA helicase [Myxococcales bacterium]MCB9644337.1 replicative DNA helicase [Myxococcales bacterium]